MRLRLPAVDALIPVFRQELHPAVAGSVLLRLLLWIKEMNSQMHARALYTRYNHTLLL